ncbi:hypothetical protein [Ensifer sp. R-19]|uniref:hypothetical protein n=1 Tax=Ensifer sp. R-19 TaxID=3404055 RepID=UPI003CFA0AA5
MDLSGICYEQAGVDLAIANNRIVELSLKISAVAKELQTLRAQLQVLHEKERDELRSSTAVATSTSGEGSLGGNVASGAAGIASRLSRRLVSSRGKRQEVLHWGIDEVCGGSPRLPGRHIVNLAGERRLTISGWAVPADLLAPFERIQIILIGGVGKLVRSVSVKERGDVADHFQRPAMSRSGFVFELAASDLPPGIYSVEIEGERKDGATLKSYVGEIEVK